MHPSTTNPSIINEILALVSCQSLYNFFGDFNLPSDVVCTPLPLSERAKQTLQKIASLTGNYFKVLARTNELFYEFLSKLGEDYSSETVREFIDWIKRHEVDNDYYACLTLWGYTLASFDGWALYRLLETTQLEELQKRVFATYQRLLNANKKLSVSWIDEIFKNIQDRLETLQPTEYRDYFLEHFSDSEQMSTIKSLMYTERAYRFLADLKRDGSEEEMSQIIACAKMLGENSGWPPTCLKELVYFRDKQRGWLLSNAARPGKGTL